MQPSVAHPAPPAVGDSSTPSLKAVLAAAAAGSVGGAIGTRLAVQGQRLVQKFRESRI